VDPPYFEVKGGFDFIWPDFDSYLKSVEQWASEIARVANDSASLFWWGHADKIAYTQIILDKHLKLENSLVWEKTDSMQYQYYSPDMARRFNTHNERVLYYSKGLEPEEYDKTGLERVMEEHIAPRSPFAKYLRDEFKRAGVSNKEIAALFPSRTGGLTGCVSNWLNGQNVITEGQYLKIRAYLNGEFLRKEYEELRKEYEELRKEYEELRRPFNNYLKLTDVLTFSQQGSETSKNDHPTQKPPALCSAIVEVTGRKGGRAFIPFMGSGTEAIACHNFGMSVTACEIDGGYYQAACDRFKRETAQVALF
jgi:site-specific DNA-methyltransferase (adenine-specific)